MPEDKKPAPELKDVEPGSDADATPTPEVGKTPSSPNEPKPPAKSARLR